MRLAVVRYHATVSKTEEALQAQTEQHRQAAEAAEAATQWQQAIDEYEACLSLLIQTAAAGGLEEAALLTALGRCYWNLSEARTAWRTLRRAISISQERADGVAQAKATVEILHIWGPPERHRMMAEDALEALGDGDPYLRALLLLDLGWQNEPSDDADDRYAEALSLAEEHGFEDILTSRVQRQAWSLMEEGKLDEAIALFESAHETYARLHVHHVAAGVLRGAGFNLSEVGRLDQGYEFAQRAFAYAVGVNLTFVAQLALMDMIGVAFARDEFDRCEELLASSPGDSDFRADLYRMWMAEARGDMESALQLMVDPDRGGKAPTAVGQIHAAAAGLLFRAGKEDAARAALQAWVAVERPGGDEPYWLEAAPLTECLIALGDEELVGRVHQAFLAQEERTGSPARFSTLQGRALAPVRAAVCLRLGLLDDAERHYREGLGWCEQERLPRDAERCRAGLTEVAARR